MKKTIQLLIFVCTTFCFGQTPIQTFDFEDNLTNVANNITLTGAGVAYENGLAGKGRALVINDSYTTPMTSRANGGISNMPLNSDARSFSFWLKVPAQAGLPAPSSTTPEGSRIFRIGSNLAGSSPQGFEFRRRNFTNAGCETRFEIYDTGNSAILGALCDNSAVSNFVGVWRHFIVSYGSGTYAIFVDGSRIGNFTANLNSGITNTMTIGGGPDNNQFSIDKFQIFDSNLTNTEALNLFKEEIRVPIASTQYVCAPNGTATVADLDATPFSNGTIRWYNPGGTLLTSTDALIDNLTYSVCQVISGVEGNRTPVLVRLQTTTAPNFLPSTIPVCKNGAPTAGDIQNFVGHNLKWYASATATSPMNSATALSASNNLFVSDTANGCEGPKVARTVTFTNTPDPTGNATQTLPIGATIASIVVSPTTIRWYETLANAQSDTSRLLASTPLVNGRTYYAIAVTPINNSTPCTSTNALAVTVTLSALSVADFDENSKFDLYPNPAKSNISIDSKNELKSVEIFSMQGQKILTSSQKVINVSSLSKGVYMTRIEDVSGAVTTKKLVIE